MPDEEKLNEEYADGMCDPGLQPEPTLDKDVAGIVLFADVDPTDVDAIERRVDEWGKLFNA